MPQPQRSTTTDEPKPPELGIPSQATNIDQVGARFTLSPRTYDKVALVSGLLLAMIVLTGAAVRLTSAGLGCEEWPNCNEGSLTPEWELHGWIEFGNRLISGLVALGTGAAVVGAYRRRPKRKDLVSWSWGLAAGVFAQVLLGAVTVILKLDPSIVGLHFLLSMVLIWNSIVLWVRSTRGKVSKSAISLFGHRFVWLARCLVTASVAVLISGVLVTGTGPNSGDARATRFPFDLTAIARVHGVLVWVLVALVIAVTVQLRRTTAGSSRHLESSVWLLAVSVLQGAVGYTQYSLGMPPWLVAVHICGAITVWGSAVYFYLTLSQRTRY